MAMNNSLKGIGVSPGVSVGPIRKVINEISTDRKQWRMIRNETWLFPSQAALGQLVGVPELNVQTIALGRHHLALEAADLRQFHRQPALHQAGALMRVQDHDIDPVAIGAGLDGRRPRIARGGADDGDVAAARRQQARHTALAARDVPGEADDAHGVSHGSTSLLLLLLLLLLRSVIVAVCRTLHQRFHRQLHATFFVGLEHFHAHDLTFGQHIGHLGNTFKDDIEVFD